jgi:hypothetical protein
VVEVVVSSASSGKVDEKEDDNVGEVEVEDVVLGKVRV